jgi:tRNA G46 methylase TrmB
MKFSLVIVVFCSYQVIALRFSTRRLRRNSSRLGDTRYTINDSICPPTKTWLLNDIVRRNCNSIDTFLDRKPIASHTLAAFNEVQQYIDHSKEIILDSGCGTGRSTRLLGIQHPDKQVIGIDRSFVRLSKANALQESSLKTSPSALKPTQESRRPYHSVASSNVVFVRAELADFWRCCVEEGWNISHHYLLYPNPYPTKARIKQRWYAHPSFPLILKLGGDITLRSNWEGYLHEFALSVLYADEFWKDEQQSRHCRLTNFKNYAAPYRSDAKLGPQERIDKTVAWTNFEKKYDNVGETTYELVLRAHSPETGERILNNI